MGRTRLSFEDLDDIRDYAEECASDLKKVVETASGKLKIFNKILRLARFQSNDGVAKFIQEHVGKLQSITEKAKKEIEKYRRIASVCQEQQDIKDREKTKSKKGKLRLRWNLYPDGDGWFSEAGNVYKRGGKYTGFPDCWRDRGPVNEDDKSHDHMVQRPARYWLEQSSEMVLFDTLVDCQLAVERALFQSLGKKTKTHHKGRS